MMGESSTRNMYSVIEINKLRKVTSCWLCKRNISDDARTYECQKCVILLYASEKTGGQRMTTYGTLKWVSKLQFFVMIPNVIG
jgi:hypothetical protein